MKADDVLKHYGIMGMKWGVRRERGPDGLVTNKIISEDYKKSRELASKSTAHLSNADLKTINERLQLERSYASLTKREISIGEKFVKDVLYNAAKQTASVYVTRQLATALNLRPQQPDGTKKK